ncbi:MAG TPA: copper resistance protein CopC, partial [Xanthobacteraceae bacterium]
MLLTFLACALAPQAALAHASLVASVPASDAVLPAPPREIELRFDEPVQPLVLQLIGPDGVATPLTRHRVDGGTVTADLPALGNGTHALSWRVASADGHPVGGTVVFSVGAPSGGFMPDAAAHTPRAVLFAIWMSRTLLFLALFVGVGGSFFVVWCVPGGLPRSGNVALSALLGIGAAAALLSVGLQGLDALALPWPKLAEPDTWRAGMTTAYGTTAVLAFSALIAAYAALQGAGAGIRKMVALAALLGVGLAISASGHAATAEPQLVTTTLVFLHVVTIAFWVGALFPLALLLCGRHAAGAALIRFGKLIPLPLGALILTGAALAFVQLQAVSDLWTTNYGRVLAAKLALLILLFGLALLNRAVLTPRFTQGDGGAPRRLCRSIAAELVIVTVILGVVGLWRFTPPPRLLAHPGPGQIETHLQTGRVMADVTLSPAKDDGWTLLLELQTITLEPLDPKEVGVLLSKPAAGIEPIRHAARRLETGRW